MSVSFSNCFIAFFVAFSFSHVQFEIFLKSIKDFRSLLIKLKNRHLTFSIRRSWQAHKIGDLIVFLPVVSFANKVIEMI